jgi:Flp pilus assembly protein TadD
MLRGSRSDRKARPRASATVRTPSPLTWNLDRAGEQPDPGTMTASIIHALALWATLLGVGSAQDVANSTAPVPEDRAERAMQHVSEGTKLRRSGELLEACRHFRFAVGLTPTWPMARYELGRCLRLIGDPLGDAGSHLEIAHRGLPGRIAAVMELGRLSEDRRDSKSARVWYREAVEIDPKASEPPLALARLGCSGAGIASFEHARRLVRADATDPAAHRALADASRDAGFEEQAREAYSWLLAKAFPSWRSIAANARLDRTIAPPSKVSESSTRRRRNRRRR